MATKYWIKLYHETLHDRKIATLDDHLWRRFVEVLLLAGENNEDGYLPQLEDMAWALRDNTEILETDLNELIRIGIIEYRDGRYYVRNFSKRQEPLPKAEYMRRKRNETQLQEHYQSRYQHVTNSNAESDTDTESDIDAYHRRYNVTPPKTAKQAMNHPAFAPYLTATGNILPRDDKYINVVDAINLIAPRFQNEQELFAYLQPFYLDWMNRKRKDGEPYNKNNPAWLDWAIAGSIPSALQAEPQIFASETY